MVQVYNIFEIAGIGFVLSIAFLTFSCDAVSGVEFVEKPGNVTLNSSWKQFTLNCSVAMATADGVDWDVQLDGQTEPEVIFETLANYSKPGYVVEQPNNRTVNLIISATNFQNSSVAGKYCCDGNNGARTSVACAYVNTGVSQSPNTDMTKANEATTNIATSPDLSTTPSGGLPPEAVAAIATPSVIVFIIVLLVVCFRDPRCPIYKCRQSSNQSRDKETTPETENLTPI